MQLKQIVDLSPVEAARIGFRVARGERLSVNFEFHHADGSLATDMDQQYPQLVLRPRSRGGAHGYDLLVEPTSYYGTVEIDGAFFQDQNGYIAELYSRDVDGHPLDLLAHGEVAYTGGAYAYEGPFGPMTLPTPPAGPAGEMGPAGADSTVPGPQGEPGTRGTMWFTGEGPPVGGTDYIEGDMYLDQSNGDTWRFDSSMGTWARS